ncbi:MAG: hypothetical protein GY849_05325 [Deltaproteobacteria bacterium]|nr:hypothetical protein [Deltaproteobacteria bacterium]
MEVLDPGEAEKENKGVMVDGLTWFPKAKPLKMLRIFRTRFKDLGDALEELKRVKIVETFLAPDHVAKSEEFLVTYVRQGTHHLLLCGLQEYVEGEILDPWSPIDERHLVSLLGRMGSIKFNNTEGLEGQMVQRVRRRAGKFIQKIREMIVKEAHIPDLAGIGNLLLTRSGDIKLVDINNISRVSFDPVIHLDDRGYPVCDKSMEALSLLDRKLLGRPFGSDDVIYGLFLDPKRMQDVKAMAMAFHQHVELGIRALTYPT